MAIKTTLKIASCYKGACINAMRYYEDGTFCDGPFCAYRDDVGTYYILDMFSKERVSEGLSAKAARQDLRFLTDAVDVKPQARVITHKRRLIIV